LGDAADRKVGKTRQDSSEIIADVELQATAGFDDGEDGYSLFRTVGTSSFLAFSHPHKVFGRFDIELLSALVTDDHLLSAGGPAHAFLGLTGNQLLNPGQIDR
jgi:hypothetical protein